MNAATYMEMVHRLPCLVCELTGEPSPQVEAHHVGTGDERTDWLVVPLCVEHHRGATGVHGLSRRGFERRYKLTDLMMVGMTLNKICRGL